MSDTILDLSDFSDDELTQLRAAYKSSVLAGSKTTSWSVNGTSVNKTVDVSTEVLGRSLRHEMRVRGITPEGRSSSGAGAHAPASYVVPFSK